MKNLQEKNVVYISLWFRVGHVSRVSFDNMHITGAPPLPSLLHLSNAK